MARNYDQEPQVLKFEVEVYVYEGKDLTRQIERFKKDLSVEEAVLNLFGGYFSDDVGLNEVSVKIEE